MWFFKSQRKKYLTKLQHPFLLKKQKQKTSPANWKQKFLNLRKDINKKPAADMLNGEKLNAFAIRSRIRKDVHSYHFYSTWY